MVHQREQPEGRGHAARRTRREMRQRPAQTALRPRHDGAGRVRVRIRGGGRRGAPGGPGADGARGRGHDVRRGQLAHPARPSRQPGAVAERGRRRRQARSGGPLQRASAHAHLSASAHDSLTLGVVPRHRGRAGNRTHALRGREPERETHSHFSAGRGPGAALLQRAQYGPPGRGYRPDAPAAQRRRALSLALYRRAQYASVPFRLRLVVHAVHLFTPHPQRHPAQRPRAQLRPIRRAPRAAARFRRSEEHRGPRGRGSGPALHPRARHERRSPRPRAQRIRARPPRAR